MYHRTDVVYQYDGSFDGLLCCVFRAFYQREDPIEIRPAEEAQSTLLSAVTVPTRPDQARRVLRSIPEKIAPAALRWVELAFLSCMEEKELAILRFLRLGYRLGPQVLRQLTDERVRVIYTAAQNVLGEAHLLKGFTRFSQYDAVLAAEIEPKNHVLPLLLKHFRARMPGESFLIYDRTHRSVLLFSGGNHQILPLESLSLPEAEAPEQLYRRLWTRFYNTISIEGRYNPKCRQTHMPKRFWGTMTEFQPETQGALPRPKEV